MSREGLGMISGIPREISTRSRGSLGEITQRSGGDIGDISGTSRGDQGEIWEGSWEDPGEISRRYGGTSGRSRGDLREVLRSSRGDEASRPMGEVGRCSRWAAGACPVAQTFNIEVLRPSDHAVLTYGVDRTALPPSPTYPPIDLPTYPPTAT